MIFPLCGFALLTVILLKLSDELFPKFKPLVLCGTGIFFFVFFIGKIAPLWKMLFELASVSQYEQLFSVLFKGLAIAILISVSASFCRDLGEERVAERLEICGKGAILYLCLPLLEYLFNRIGELIL